MKYGIFSAFWEKEWTGDYPYYIEKVARLGFDVLEIAAQQLNSYGDRQLAEIRKCAKDNGVILTAGIGPSRDHDLSSADQEVREAGRAYFEAMLDRLGKLDAHIVGGALYSYWPIDFSQPLDKPGDRARGIEGIRAVAGRARELGIDLCLEVLNRFENHVLNTAEEGVAFVTEVGAPNVKVMLDTFHMNIEEDSMGGAIRTAGPLLGHFHTGECNRRVPGRGRTPWREIGDALKDVHYDSAVVMEPFIRSGGAVGRDVKVWRDLSGGMNEAQMDEEARQALVFSRYALG